MASKPMPASMFDVKPLVTAPCTWYAPAMPTRAPEMSITQMVSDVTYNAITTDFWHNLDAISGKDSWRMYGTTGDAKGQPVQINHPSHGSPYLRIRKVMVGAAYS